MNPQASPPAAAPTAVPPTSPPAPVAAQTAIPPGQAYKVCPVCRQPAALNAPACGRCGHEYRTQFSAREQTQMVLPPPVYSLPPQTYQPLYPYPAASIPQN